MMSKALTLCRTFTVGSGALIVTLGIVASLSVENARADAARDADLLEQASGLFEPIPPEPPQLPGNPLTAEKIELGKMLFFEPRLSASWFLSCNSCHNMATGGVDLQPTSIGHGWHRGGRNAPTVLNSVFNFAQFWDGRAKDLMEQAQGPVQAAVEMNSKPADVVATLNAIPEYRRRFAAASLRVATRSASPPEKRSRYASGSRRTSSRCSRAGTSHGAHAARARGASRAAKPPSPSRRARRRASASRARRATVAGAAKPPCRRRGAAKRRSERPSSTRGNAASSVRRPRPRNAMSPRLRKHR